MASRGGVGVGVDDFYSRPASFNLRSCGGHGLGEAFMGLGEGGVGVADRDGQEFHFPSYGHATKGAYLFVVSFSF